MSAEQNRTVVRRYIDEVFNQGKVEVARELVTEGYVHHDPATAELGSGAEGLEKLVRFYRDAFPDFEIRVDDQIATDERVVERWTGRGTHRGTVMGIPGSGKTVSASGITIHRLEGGRIAETWTVFDSAGMLRQIGGIPGGPS